MMINIVLLPESCCSGQCAAGHPGLAPAGGRRRHLRRHQHHAQAPADGVRHGCSQARLQVPFPRLEQHGLFKVRGST